MNGLSRCDFIRVWRIPPSLPPSQPLAHGHPQHRETCVSGGLQYTHLIVPRTPSFRAVWLLALPLVFSSPDGHMLYMGKDKYENEDLIRYGFPEDVWFHVDNLSSAHVYLRMNRGEKVRSVAGGHAVDGGPESCDDGGRGSQALHAVVYDHWTHIPTKPG